MLRRAQGEEIADAEPAAEAEADEEVVEARRICRPERFAELRRQGAVRADGVGARLRQAVLVVRVPDLRPRRQRHRRHGRQRPQRAARRLVPGRRQRSDHAGDRRRPAHPLPGRRRAHRRPQHAGRAHLQDRRRGEGRLRRAHPRRRQRWQPRKAGENGDVAPSEYAEQSTMPREHRLRQRACPCAACSRGRTLAATSCAGT